MSYVSFETRIYPIFIYYIILSVFGVLISIQMYFKYRKRKVKEPLYLMAVFISLTLALIFLTIGLAEAAIRGFFMEVYRISLPLAYSMVILADFSLNSFASHITDKGKKFTPLMILIGSVIMIALFLPWNWWGYPSEEYVGELNTRFYTTGSLVIFSCAIFIYIVILCNKVAKTTQNKIIKTGLRLFVYSMFCLILLFACITGDTLLIVFFDHPGYSVFLYVGWLFGVAFVILSYLSLVMPEWLVRKIE